jgi:hypothetical protein
MDTESYSAVEVFRSVSVPLSQARAFELFTTRMTEFWPKEHSIGDSEVAEVVLPDASDLRRSRGLDRHAGRIRQPRGRAIHATSLRL